MGAYFAKNIDHMELSLATKIIIGIIVLHLIGGFGWLLYKLSPRKSDSQEVLNEDKN